MIKLIFKQHIVSFISKVNKGKPAIGNIRYNLAKKSTVTKYKSFLRSNMEILSMTNLKITHFVKN